MKEEEICARTIGKALLTNTIAYNSKYMLKYGKCQAMIWLRDEIKRLSTQPEMNPNALNALGLKDSRSVNSDTGG